MIFFFAVSSATCISKERVADIVTGIIVVYFDAITVDSGNVMLFCSIYRFSGYYCSS